MSAVTLRSLLRINSCHQVKLCFAKVQNSHALCTSRFLAASSAKRDSAAESADNSFKSKSYFKKHYALTRKQWKARNNNSLNGNWVKPTFLRGVELLLLIDDVKARPAAMEDVYPDAQNVVASYVYDAFQKPPKFDFTTVTLEIENRWYNEAEWNEIKDKVNIQYYSQTMVQKALMKFLLPDHQSMTLTELEDEEEKEYQYKDEDLTNLFPATDRIEIEDVTNDPRHHAEWIKSPLVQSYLSYLINDKDAFDTAQPCLVQFCAWCYEHQLSEPVVSLYSRIDDKVEVWLPLLLGKIFATCMASDQSKELLYRQFRQYYQVAEAGAETGRRSCYINFVVKLLKMNDKEMAVKLLRTLLEINHRHLNLPIKFYYLQRILEQLGYSEDRAVWNENRNIVERFFDHLHSKSLAFQDKESARAIGDWFQQIEGEQWKVKWFQTRDLRYGKCPITRVAVDNCELKANEFYALKQNVISVLLRQVLTTVDVNVLSANVTESVKHGTPRLKGMLRYLEFLTNQGPFDLVIDGLNIAYSFSSNRINAKRKFSTGLRVANAAILQFRKRMNRPRAKALVYFRAHMKDDVMREGQFLFENADVYFVANDYEDDSCQLYATLCSGPQCFIVSNDLYRNYRNHLYETVGPAAATLFNKFQMSRQLSLMPNSRQVLGFPTSINPVIQKHGDVWHFPYFSEGPRVRGGSTPHNWILRDKANGLIHSEQTTRAFVRRCCVSVLELDERLNSESFNIVEYLCALKRRSHEMLP